MTLPALKRFPVLVLRVSVLRLLALRLSALSALLLFGCGAGTGVQFDRADGSSDALADQRGKWVLVNYWAEWCAPCRHEIPDLNALQAARKSDLTVYGVNFDGIAGAELKALASRMGIAFPLLRKDPGVALGVPKPEVLPTTIVIDPAGGVRVLIGPQTLATLTAALVVPAASVTTSVTVGGRPDTAAGPDAERN